MGVVVQKYGGSSVADLDRLRRVAERVVNTRRAGNDVVVVVSAMGNTTNELLDLARRVSPSAGRREIDMLISVGERISMALLSMAITAMGEPAISFTGSQSGIITDESHSAARILAVRPDRVRAALAEGKITIVAGFQGVSRDREVTTLGRGGSDLTAVALAAALGADWCEICSDVDGVYSADPRVVPDAIRLDTLSLDEALAQARNGARVLYGEAVAYAHRVGIALMASATVNDQPGSRIQVPPLPPRVAAITADDQLEAFVSADLPSLLLALQRAGAELRAVSGGVVYVDLRNWHDRARFVLPDGASSEGRVAVVAAVGAGVTVDAGALLAGGAALAEAGIPVAALWADGAALCWRVAPAQMNPAQRALHGALLTTPVKTA